jgi:hypothetical protein
LCGPAFVHRPTHEKATNLDFVESLASARLYEIATRLNRAAHHTTKGKVFMRADALRFQFGLKFL